MSISLIIAFIAGNSGPKATAVTFLKTEDGVSQWAWIANDVASRLRPGMRLIVGEASTSRVQTQYEKDGQQVALKVPRQQLFLGGSISVELPDTQPIAPATWTFGDEVDKYTAAYDAKRATAPANADEPF
jgi:hypothetical protein